MSAIKPLSEPNPSPTKRTRKLKAKLAGGARWLHIYTSLFGLIMTLFFSITGFTLNHAGWFHASDQGTVQVTGVMDHALLGDASKGPNELAIVETLRDRHSIKASLRNLTIDEFQCSVAFAGPGYTADAIIDRESGRYTLDATDLGWVAVFNDLHKGRDTGPAWSLLIDISAGLLTLISLTGLTLMIWLRRRWMPGALTTVIGGLVLVIVYWMSC